jgi:hypothetical protein
MAQIAHVSFCPASLAGVVKAVAQQEGIEPLFGASLIVRCVGACPADIANGFIQRRRNANRRDVSVAKELRDILSISFIGLNPLVRFALGFRGGHDDTFHLGLCESAGEDEAGWPCLIADVQITKWDIKLFGQFSQGALGSKNAAAAFPVVFGFLP